MATQCAKYLYAHSVATLRFVGAIVSMLMTASCLLEVVIRTLEVAPSLLAMAIRMGEVVSRRAAMLGIPIV